MLDGLATWHHFAADRQLVLDDPPHFRRNAVDVVRGESFRVGKIVVEAILDHRAYGHLRIRKQALDGLRQQVSGGVPDDLQAFLVPGGDNPQ